MRALCRALVRLKPGGMSTCLLAGSATKERVFICSDQELELSGSRGTANLVMRFEKGGKEHSANLQQIKGVTRAVTEEDNNTWVPVIAIECRGLEPTRWHPGDNVTVKSTGKATFSDADLSEDWADFDEDAGLSVSVMNLESKIELRK